MKTRQTPYHKGITMKYTVSEFPFLYKDYTEKSGEWVFIAERLLEAKKFIKYYEEQSLELLEKLKDISEEKNCRGSGYIFYSVKRRGAIEYSAIPGIESIDLEKYRKQDITYWKIDRE